MDRLDPGVAVGLLALCHGLVLQGVHAGYSAHGLLVQHDWGARGAGVAAALLELCKFGAQKRAVACA
jgi:hypothetical protein